MASYNVDDEMAEMMREYNINEQFNQLPPPPSNIPKLKPPTIVPSRSPAAPVSQVANSMPVAPTHEIDLVQSREMQFRQQLMNGIRVKYEKLVNAIYRLHKNDSYQYDLVRILETHTSPKVISQYIDLLKKSKIPFRDDDIKYKLGLILIYNPKITTTSLLDKLQTYDVEQLQLLDRELSRMMTALKIQGGKRKQTKKRKQKKRKSRRVY